jgi:hypothetical protein
MNRELKAPSDDAIALQRQAADAIFRSATVALPGLRGRKSGADGPQLAGVLSASAPEAVRGRSHSSALAASRAIPFRAPIAPDPRVSQPGAAGSNLQKHLGFAGLAHSGVPADHRAAA